MIFRLAITVLGLFLFTSCTSIKSSYLKSDSSGGLNYYMPKQDLVVVITVVDADKVKARNKIGLLSQQISNLTERRILESDAGVRKRITNQINTKYQSINTAIAALSAPDVLSISNVELKTGAVYPDQSKIYSLNYGLNPFGKNSLDISVSEAGLLSSTKSKSESQLVDALVNLASSAGSIVPLSKMRVMKSKPGGKVDLCGAEGRFQFTFDMSQSTPPQFKCNQDITVSISRKNGVGTVYRNGPALDKDTKAASGVFYRQKVPYEVSISYGPTNKKQVLFSPSGSETHFLPVKRSLFADNDATFKFVDGVPTEYSQNSGGEFVSLLKIPADVIAAYFGAVGSVFDGVLKKDSSEIEVLKKEFELMQERQKQERCIAALSASDTDALELLGCGD